MTDLLLDTHVAFWWFTGAPLAGAAAGALAEPGRRVLVSIASVWEVAIKEATGKLRPPEDFADTAVAEGFELLPIAVEHARAAGALPMHHRDPFDRMLVAQARTEGLVLVTRDARLQRYGVPVLEA